MAYGVDAVWHEIAVKHSLHDPHWREVILLLLGSLNRYEDAATLLVERMLQAGETDPFEPVLHRNLYLAVHALADRVEVAADLCRRIVDAMIAIVHGEPYWEWHDAFDSLSQLTAIPYAADQLLALARDTEIDTRLRSYAVLALSQPDRADEATPILLAQARDAQIDAMLRSYAVLALGQFGRTDEVASILLALAHDTQVDAGVRLTAALVLIALSWADETTTILLELACDPQVDAVVRRDAAKALGQLGRADEGVTILLALAHDAQVDAGDRLTAAQALSQLGRANESATIMLALAHDAQVNVYIRGIAAQALGQMGQTDEVTLAGLLTLARDERAYAAVRSDAAQARSASSVGPTRRRPSCWRWRTTCR